MLAVDIERKIARSIYGIGIGIGITRIPCAREDSLPGRLVPVLEIGHPWM
jgi:hypothetical protein